jgi:hypothetical protein
MKIFKLALLGAGLLTSCAVAAKDYRHAKQHARADQFYGVYHNLSPVFVPSTANPPDFDLSGTRGRDGLGASPFHPEGPGNFVD